MRTGKDENIFFSILQLAPFKHELAMPLTVLMITEIVFQTLYCQDDKRFNFNASWRFAASLRYISQSETFQSAPQRSINSLVRMR